MQFLRGSRHGYRALVLMAVAIAALGAPAARADEPRRGGLALRDGDRVAFIGNTLLERDRHYGHFETMLRSRFPGAAFSVRNMAWPGDTLDVQLRPLNFGNALEHLRRYKPTVIVVSFGMNEAFEGDAGLTGYQRSYERLLEQLAEFDAKIVILSPIRHEDMGPPLPNPAEHNAALEAYVKATAEAARRHGAAFVDLFHSLSPSTSQGGARLTDNGIHLSERGYAQAAEQIAEQLGLGPSKLDERRREIVRDAVQHKEMLFFHRWRAHNSEYIYGRRSVGKGGNSGNPTFPAEFAEFDRLIEQADQQIAKLSDAGR